MERAYGNIGCGRSWLEIDGQGISPYDLDEVARTDDDSLAILGSPTARARSLIADVQAARYDATRFDMVSAEG